MTKTFEFKKINLSKEERFQFDILSADYQIRKSAFDNYLLQFVCPRVGIDPKNGMVRYDLIKGEFTYEEQPAKQESVQPQPENKPGQSGDSKPASGGDVQREGKSNG